MCDRPRFTSFNAMPQTNTARTAPDSTITPRKPSARLSPVTIVIVVVIHIIGALTAIGLTAIGTVIAFASDGGSVEQLSNAAWYVAIWGPGIVYLFGVGWTIVGMATGHRGWPRALLTIAAAVLVTVLSFVTAIVGARM